MKNPFGQIVSFEDYVDIIGIPKEQLNSEEVKNRINKWLVQATEQFDSMISGNGQLGRLYRWFEKLEDNEEDNYKKYKLIKAICSWVETFVIKGKFWVDGLPVINSNVDIQINSSSTDSNVEAKRKDIIQDLVSVGLYQTTNFGDNNTYQDNQQNAEQLIEDLIVLSTSELQQNYLRLNPQKSLEGNLDFANNDLVNGGNIIGSTQQARNNIQYYNIIDSTIDLNKNTVIGSLPQDPTTAADIAQINQNIANINQEQITQNTNISNNENEISALKAKDTEQNNRLTQLEQETEDNFNEISSIKTKDQQQDNSIQNNTNNINANTNSINTLNQQVANNKNLLDQTIDGLRALKPFEYVGEYQNGTSYKINQLVSYNNNLYLSKEDNNTTQPTSDKWLLINKETVSVDLSNYYNKLEVDQIKTTLENNITNNTNSITTNTTNITALTNRTNTIEQNYVSKTTTTPQTIASQITFTQTDMVLKFNSGTNNSAYLAGFKSNNQRVWYFGKGSSTSDNFVIGADRGVIKLEPSTHVDISNKRIINVATPTAINDAVNKQYVDNNTLSKTSTASQTVAGPVSFTQPITVATPTANTHATTKAYVDNAIANSGGSGGSIDTSNFATLNTNQTITGAKTFDNQVIIRKDGTPLTLRAVNPGKIYMIMKGADDNSNFSLGANSSNTSLEVNRGDLTITTQQANKNIAFENAARIKFNRSVLEIGTEINAGFGGLNVKFIPEDNSTKTLQFYNNNPSDTRRFKLLVPEPTEAQNPATKNYVDNAIQNINPGSGNVPQDLVNRVQSLENNSVSKTTTTPQTVAGPVSFTQAITIPTPTNNTDAANKAYVDSATTKLQQSVDNNTADINSVLAWDSKMVKVTGDQTIRGIKTFNDTIKLNAGELSTVGTSLLSLVNKRYVDNKTNNSLLYRQVFFSNATIYNNLQTTSISINNYLSNSNNDYLKSWLIQFDRYGSNGSKYEGTFNLNFILPETGQATFVESNTYFDNNSRFQEGRKAGITIHRISNIELKLTFQLWDGGNRIKNVKLLAPPA